MATSGGILLVDDNRLDVELALDAFREAQLAPRIQVATGGEEALDYLFGRGRFSDRSAHPVPALVLLDLKMPRVDGLEVLRQVKAAPRVCRIPVVVLTTSREKTDRLRSFELGANSFIVKPGSYGDFLELARKIGDYWFSLNVPPPEI